MNVDIENHFFNWYAIYFPQMLYLYHRIFPDPRAHFAATLFTLVWPLNFNTYNLLAVDIENYYYQLIYAPCTVGLLKLPIFLRLMPSFLRRPGLVSLEPCSPTTTLLQIAHLDQKLAIEINWAFLGGDPQTLASLGPPLGPSYDCSWFRARTVRFILCSSLSKLYLSYDSTNKSSRKHQLK
jgi:hypothetical protein